MQCIWCLKQNYILYYNKLKLKMSKCLGMIWKFDHVLRQNMKFGKIYALKKSILIKKWLMLETCDILGKFQLW
jgi:hypothetical protein